MRPEKWSCPPGRALESLAVARIETKSLGILLICTGNGLVADPLLHTREPLSKLGVTWGEHPVTGLVGKSVQEAVVCNHYLPMLTR